MSCDRSTLTCCRLTCVWHIAAQVIASGQLVFIHPSSVLVGRKAPCILFSEMVRTTKQYARQVTAVELPWLPELVPNFFASKPVQP